MTFEKTPSQFTWQRLGNIEQGRQNLGSDMPVMVFRLFQYTLRDVMERKLGKDATAQMLREAGRLAGMEFCRNTIPSFGDWDFFLANLQKCLRDLKIGILRVEQVDVENMHFVFTVAEDLDCSGLPVTGDVVCHFDEGLLSGIMEAYFGCDFRAVETDCWATGDRVCRFDVTGQPKGGDCT